MANSQFIFILLVSLAISNGYYIPQSNEEVWSESDESFTTDPISTQMKCSQVASKVLCKFYFTNTAQVDYYLLERNTPLEGLRSQFLTVTHGQHVIKYEGPILNRIPATRDEFVLLTAGSTTSSPSIEVNRAYKFPRDGLYTIQYTGPLVYLSRERRDMLQDEELPQRAEEWGKELVSVEFIVRNAHELQQLEKQERGLSNIEYEDESEDGGNVIIAVSCPVPTFTDTRPTCSTATDKLKKDIITLHKQMCGIKGLPKGIKSIKDGTHATIYKRWFGVATNGRKGKVAKTLGKMLIGLKKQTSYEFSDDKDVCYDKEGEQTTLAFTFVGTTKVFLCIRYDGLSIKSSGNIITKQQVLAHEWSHAFGNTYDHENDSPKDSTDLAKSNPNKAVENADSYGFFYSEMFRSKKRKRPRGLFNN